MPVDFEALQQAVLDAKREAEEAQDAAAKLQDAQTQLATVQTHVSDAIAAHQKEHDEQIAALQKIIEIVQAGL